MFGRLEYTGDEKRGLHGWLLECRCECGTVKFFCKNNLSAGKSSSCGCVSAKNLTNLSYKHGMTNTPEFNTWRNIIARCANPDLRHFKYYGGRGISVCQEWQDSFSAFIEHIGPRPSKNHTIERIDNDGDYAPGNVRWATRLEQRRNTRARLRTAQHRGVTKSIADWARHFGVTYSTADYHLKTYRPDEAFKNIASAATRLSFSA